MKVIPIGNMTNAGARKGAFAFHSLHRSYRQLLVASFRLAGTNIGLPC
jgi:hypothetical protein